jgi:hypothetical protein
MSQAADPARTGCDSGWTICPRHTLALGEGGWSVTVRNQPGLCAGRASPQLGANIGSMVLEVLAVHIWAFGTCGWPVRRRAGDAEEAGQDARSGRSYPASESVPMC